MADWKSIGLNLGLKMLTLDIIEISQNNKAKHCCRHMLNEWLSNGKDKNWSALANAIDSEQVSRSDIADDIRKKYCRCT